MAIGNRDAAHGFSVSLSPQLTSSCETRVFKIGGETCGKTAQKQKRDDKAAHECFEHEYPDEGVVLYNGRHRTHG
jgi:hypothetical protein